jgi:O-antigen/teichoic acid export membrane protein
MNQIVRRIVKNSGYLFSATGIAAALSMLQGILTARMLGVEAFGILGTIIMFTSTVNNLVSFRMSELVIKYVGHYTETDEPSRAAALFKAAAITEMLASLVAFGLICLLAPLGALFFAKDPADANLFVLYGLIVLANLIAESSTGLLQIFDRFRRMAVLNLVQSIVTLAIISLAYFTSHEGMENALRQVLLAYLVGKAFSAIGFTIAALNEASRRWGAGWWKAPLHLLKPQARELIHFAISTNLSATISLVTKDSELLWVSFFRSPLEAGFYKLALTLTNLVEMPVNPMPQTTYPELSRQTARNNWQNVRAVLRQGSFLVGGYSLAALLGLVLLGQPLIRYIYGAEYLPSYPALVILLVGYLAANIFYWRRIALLSLGRPDFPVKLNLILALLKILGTILLLPRYGFLVSAALLAGFYWFGSIISALKVRSLLARCEKAEAVTNAV